MIAEEAIAIAGGAITGGALATAAEAIAITGGVITGGAIAIAGEEIAITGGAIAGESNCLMSNHDHRRKTSQEERSQEEQLWEE